MHTSYPGCVADAPKFEFSPILPLGVDDTPYRRLTADYVATVDTPLGQMLQVDPAALTLITQEAMRDIAALSARAHTCSSCATSSTTRKRATTIASSPSTC